MTTCSDSERALLDWVGNHADQIVTALQAVEEELNNAADTSNGSVAAMLRAHAHRWVCIRREFNDLYDNLSEGSTT